MTHCAVVISELMAASASIRALTFTPRAVAILTRAAMDGRALLFSILEIMLLDSLLWSARSWTVFFWEILNCLIWSPTKFFLKLSCWFLMIVSFGVGFFVF